MIIIHLQYTINGMSSPRSSASGDVFNMSHIVIIEPLCAVDRYTGGVRPHRFIIMEKKKSVSVKKKNKNNNHCVLNPLIYKITSITSMPSPFILVFLCLMFSYFRIRQEKKQQKQ